MIRPNSRRPRSLLNLLLVLSLQIGAGERLSAQVENPDQPGADLVMLPIWDRSAKSAPHEAIQENLRRNLELRGFSVLDPGVVDRFMSRHRIRFTGGINESVAAALRTETRVPLVLITTIDLYQEANPPKLGLTARLVTTSEPPRIVWMDSAIRSGDESPGLLGLGIVRDSYRIQEKVVKQLTKSLAALESPDADRQQFEGHRNATTARRFRPKATYQSEDFPAIRERAERVAVLPMANSSLSRYAGEIVTDQIVRHLVRSGADIIEPGVVRHILLQTRQVYTQGPSVPDTDILRIDLEADLAIYGEVVTYRETGPGNPYPMVDFSLRVIDTRSQELIWSSLSFNRGSDGVFFFDVGSVATAQDLASKMAQAMAGRATE